MIALQAEEVEPNERIHTEPAEDPGSDFMGPGQLLGLLDGNTSAEEIAQRMTQSLSAIHQAQLLQELRYGAPLIET